MVMSPQERAEVRRLHRERVPRKEIAGRLGHKFVEVYSVLRVSTAAEERWFNPGRTRLSLTDREEIRAGLERGETYKAIAAQPDWAISTISREVAHNGGRVRYRRCRPIGTPRVYQPEGCHPFDDSRSCHTAFQRRRSFFCWRR